MLQILLFTIVSLINVNNTFLTISGVNRAYALLMPFDILQQKIYLLMWKDGYNEMKKLSMEHSRKLKAGSMHYHWTCIEPNNRRKRYISKPYYYNALNRTGHDIDAHNSQKGHDRYTKMIICYKNCN